MVNWDMILLMVTGLSLHGLVFIIGHRVYVKLLNDKEENNTTKVIQS